MSNYISVEETRAYLWGREDGRPVHEGHIEQLRVFASEHIAKMMAQGLLDGNMSYTCSDGTRHIGSWDHSYKVREETREGGRYL